MKKLCLIALTLALTACDEPPKDTAKDSNVPTSTTAKTPTKEAVKAENTAPAMTPTQAKLEEMSKKTGVDTKTLQGLIDRAKQIITEDKKPTPTDDQMLEVIEFGNSIDKECPKRTGDAKKCVMSSFALYLTGRGNETHENTMKGLKELMKGAQATNKKPQQ